MEDFRFYFILGQNHILDLQGYDHILFVVALCVVYSHRSWKNLAWLVTAFTLGHSITLALSTLRMVNINSDLIEFMIPITIFITAILNLTTKKEEVKINPFLWQRYVLALFFGLIHGLGFSNFLKSILGKAESIWLPLLYFNVGLELGQLLIVAGTLVGTYLLVDILRLKMKTWIVLVSISIAAIALVLTWQNQIF